MFIGGQLGYRLLPSPRWKGNLKRCEDLDEMVGDDDYDAVLRSQMLCSMTKLKGPSHLVALLHHTCGTHDSITMGISIPMASPSDKHPLCQGTWRD